MADTDSLSDQEIVARTAWGEARSLGRDGMQATINTLQNRVASGVHWWGTSLRSCALRPYQYSCWLAADPNRPKLLAVAETDPEFIIAIDLAADAIFGNLPDIVSGADSYYALSLPTPPKWSEGLKPVATIGNQVYFKTLKTFNS